jgi:hypothetical protein
MFTGLYKLEGGQDNGKWNSKRENNNNTSFLTWSTLTAVSLTQTVLALKFKQNVVCFLFGRWYYVEGPANLCLFC